jgi:hypothetical protein
VTLTLSDGPTIENPSAQEIESALRDMEATGGEFAILDRGELDYMQAAGGDDEYGLEYQEGSLDRHYRVENVTLGAVIEAFQQYARGEDSAWKSRFAWQHLPL